MCLFVTSWSGQREKKKGREKSEREREVSVRGHWHGMGGCRGVAQNKSSQFFHPTSGTSCHCGSSLHLSVHTNLACVIYRARKICLLVSTKGGRRQPLSPALLKQTPSSNRHYTLRHSSPKQSKASNPPNNYIIYNSRYNEHDPTWRHGHHRRRHWHEYVKS